MSRRPRLAYATVIGFPRVSGDEPPRKRLRLVAVRFSPRERG
mgnify:CR=1 FL=1